MLSDTRTSRPRHVLVVGAGIVGVAVAVARELLQRFPGLEVTVLEKEDFVGTPSDPATTAASSTLASTTRLAR